MTGTKFYALWKGMHGRCKNPQTKSFNRYGGRGIKVCERWSKFENFYDDMFSGYEEGLQLDRINTDGDYSPSNCKWSTRIENANNRCNNKILVYQNKVYTMSQLAREFNLPRYVLKNRINRGWSVEKAIETPTIRRKKNV